MRLTLAVSIALLATSGIAVAEQAKPKPKQLIIISFDGAHDNRLWDRSRKLAKKTGAHFTYFLSCTYLINPADRHAYKAPHEKAGRSATGWGRTRMPTTRPGPGRRSGARAAPADATATRAGTSRAGRST